MLRQAPDVRTDLISACLLNGIHPILPSMHETIVCPRSAPTASLAEKSRGATTHFVWGVAMELFARTRGMTSLARCGRCVCRTRAIRRQFCSMFHALVERSGPSSLSPRVGSRILNRACRVLSDEPLNPRLGLPMALGIRRLSA